MSTELRTSQLLAVAFVRPKWIQASDLVRARGRARLAVVASSFLSNRCVLRVSGIQPTTTGLSEAIEGIDRLAVQTNDLYRERQRQGREFERAVTGFRAEIRSST